MRRPSRAMKSNPEVVGRRRSIAKAAILILPRCVEICAVPWTSRACTRSRTMVAKASSRSAGLDTGIGTTTSPRRGAICSFSRFKAATDETFSGVWRIPMRSILGLISLSSSRFFSSMVSIWFTTPMMLPPGRASAQAHRYTRTGHDDGYLRGLAARRIERLRVAHHNDINLESTEFRRQLEEARWIQVGITHLQHHVAPLLPAVLAQALNQRLQPRWSDRRV